MGASRAASLFGRGGGEEEVNRVTDGGGRAGGQGGGRGRALTGALHIESQVREAFCRVGEWDCRYVDRVDDAVIAMVPAGLSVRHVTLEMAAVSRGEDGVGDMDCERDEVVFDDGVVRYVGEAEGAVEGAGAGDVLWEIGAAFNGEEEICARTEGATPSAGLGRVGVGSKPVRAWGTPRMIGDIHPGAALGPGGEFKERGKVPGRPVWVHFPGEGGNVPQC